MWGYGPDWGMMGSSGWGPLNLILWLLVLGIVIAGVIWLVRGMTQRSGSAHGLAPRRPSGLEVLEERYARGEINRDEYLQKKRDILG